MGTCICCVCSTSFTSHKQQPNTAVISAKLQKSSADHIIKTANEPLKCRSCHAAAPAFITRVLAWAPRLPAPLCPTSSTGRVGVPVPAPGLDAPCVQLCALPDLCSLPPCSQRAKLFLQPTSNRFCPSAAMRALKASRGRCFCDL